MGRIESGFLKICGYALIALTVYFLFLPDVTRASLCAAIGLLLFFLARLSQFKRFKGWGFEAEMWDEKQQEAEKLVESLKSVASLTAREVMLQSIRSGRWGSSKRWDDHWKLFDEIKSAQSGLITLEGQREIKKSIDRWFLHDMALNEFGELKQIAMKKAEQARKGLREKSGNPISDLAGYQTGMQRLSEVDKSIGLFELAGSRPLVETIEEWWGDMCNTLDDFGIELEMPVKVRSRLDVYKALEGLPEMPVTKELISSADRE